MQNRPRIAALLIAIVAAALELRGVQPRVVVLDNVRVVAGTGAAPIEGARIVIEGDRIQRVGLAAAVPIGEGAERMALNAPIQGSAADVIKVAMLGVDHALRDNGMRSRMLLQVHDELVLEVAPGERDDLERLVREQMGAAADLAVPLEVSVGAGHSWDDAAH